MNRYFWILILLLASSSVSFRKYVGKEFDIGEEVCTDGWEIAGYYTPDERDFIGPKIEVKVNKTIYEFKEDFVQEVRIQGTGKTEYGWFLTCCWEKRERKVGTCDQTLVKLTSVMREPLLYDCGQCFHIHTPELKEYTFIAEDSSNRITGQSLGVYCGEGKEAKELIPKIARTNVTVCTC